MKTIFSLEAKRCEKVAKLVIAKKGFVSHLLAK
jgi:hypothetical protein